MKDNKIPNLKHSSLGIEFGSTRIKAVLIDSNFSPIAHGEYTWENEFKNGFWIYELENVWKGLQKAYSELKKRFEKEYLISLTEVGSIGISGMMHGYLPFNERDELLTKFRTWRNTNTGVAAEKLSSLFQFNIPLSWSIAHLYQAMLDNEKHVQDINFLTTLSGYIHWQLTNHKTVGVGEASGMFPLNNEEMDFNALMIQKFQELPEVSYYNLDIKNIFPNIKYAGLNAGYLTPKGAKLLDPSGDLQSGIPFCPPEGDAATGMVATNTIQENYGNISAGTSIFSMIVLNKELKNYYEEIDIVFTPDGKPVAMIHCNNFTSDIDAWIELFQEFVLKIGHKVPKNFVYKMLYKSALQGDEDTGGLVHCNYYSGEPVTGIEDGRPLFIRMANSKFNLNNFMRSNIYSALATLKIGLDTLTERENVKVHTFLGHGGFFKTEGLSEQLMADALNTQVSTASSAGEGGPWGMALLANFLIQNDKDLLPFLQNKVFNKQQVYTTAPSMEGHKSFSIYLQRYKQMLSVEKEAIKQIYQ